MSESATAPTATPPNATLTAEVTLGAPTSTSYSPQTRGLVAEYTVTNAGDQPILVLAERVHGQSGASTAPAEPESAWVGVGTPGVLRLSKQIFPIEAGVALAQPFRGHADLVQPGESVSGRMFVLTPPQGDLPSEGPSIIAEQLPEGSERRVEVCVQVAPDPRLTFPDAPTDAMTNDTPERFLVCSDLTPLPAAKE